jgi:hypothetical protein
VFIRVHLWFRFFLSFFFFSSVSSVPPWFIYLSVSQDRRMSRLRISKILLLTPRVPHAAHDNALRRGDHLGQARRGTLVVDEEFEPCGCG